MFCAVRRAPVWDEVEDWLHSEKALLALTVPWSTIDQPVPGPSGRRTDSAVRAGTRAGQTSRSRSRSIPPRSPTSTGLFDDAVCTRRRARP